MYVKKILLSLVLMINFSFSSEEVNKTSELELFLFKVGFESLLKDVEDIKMKSNLNTKDLENLTNKMEYVFNEITKNKTDLSQSFENTNSKKETIELKSIILALEQRIEKLEAKLTENKRTKIKKVQKIQKAEKVEKAVKTINLNESFEAKVNIDVLDVYTKPYVSSAIIKSLEIDTFIALEYCDKYGWCKINGQKGYVKKHLIKISAN